MKSLLVLALIISSALAFTLKENCEVVTQEDCETLTSEYEKYRECMEHRSKRSVDCQSDDDDSCDSCDCNSCNGSCENCNYNNCCSRCCQNSSCKSYNCCHQTCRAECRSNSCRTACKKKCQEKIVTNGGKSPGVSVNVTNQGAKSQHNITTVIHLNNVINNTNLINLPITVNNTVFNNLTNMARNGRETTKDNCCLTIGPRQCVPQKEFPFTKCFHIRKRVCGNVCSAPVVHYQKHEICDNDVNIQQPCRQQIIYIPQPQPRCAYQQNWPYVACGNQNLHTCDGCYDHYIKREDVTRCSNFCYDDGYGIGPYYRQGPFYRPGYAHGPSCYQTGSCYGFPDLDRFPPYPEYGFPYMYPPNSYPFIIEDCENCSSPLPFVGTSNPVLEVQNGNFDSVQWTNFSDKMMNIDAQVYPVRTGRYAEIKISTKKKQIDGNLTASE